jgi:predicted transcriptional regulator
MIYYVLVINLAELKKQREKEEYELIERVYNNNVNENVKLNNIQTIFFNNLKTIFNSYNSYIDKLDRERNSNIVEIDNHISLIVYIS